MESTEKANFGPVSSRIGLEPLRSLGPLWGPFPGGGGGQMPNPIQSFDLEVWVPVLLPSSGLQEAGERSGSTCAREVEGLKRRPPL